MRRETPQSAVGRSTRASPTMGEMPAACTGRSHHAKAVAAMSGSSGVVPARPCRLGDGCAIRLAVVTRQNLRVDTDQRPQTRR